MKVTGCKMNDLLSSLLQFFIISSGRDGRDGRKGFVGARGMPGPKGIHYDLLRIRKDFPCFNLVKKQKCKNERTRNALGTRTVARVSTGLMNLKFSLNFHQCFCNTI